MGCFGVALGCVGWDIIAGNPRITFGLDYLCNGLPVVPLLMGLFGVSEVLINLEKTYKIEVFKDVKNIWPSLKDLRKCIFPILRGSGIGFLVGMLPGGGTIISTFASYSIEKRISKNPEEFGKGAIEGVAAPESANNACAQAGFIPLLTLGIPISPVFAVVFAALLIHGIHPGPMLISKTPNVFWGVITSMYLGNIILLILNLPLIKMWVKILEVPYSLLFPLILLFCLVGSLSEKQLGDVYVMLVFGITGYLMKKFGYEPAPLIIAFVLSTPLEMNLRQALILSDGSFGIFFTKPISLVCLIAVGLIIMLGTLQHYKGRRPQFGKE